MKIGLIAMTGTPILDIGVKEIVEESASLRARLAAVASLPSLGLLTVAAVIGQRAQVEYMQCRSASEWNCATDSFDLIAISTLSAQIEEAFALGRRFQQQNIPVLIGGMHASMLPEHVRENGFIPVIGEAELCWQQIIDDLEIGTLQPEYGNSLNICDLSRSPVPAYELLDPAAFPRVPVQTSRGCPHRCDFCGASILLSPKYRQKSVSQVLAEIDRIAQLWRRPFIEFVDDNALVDPRYWKPLLKELQSRNVRWFAECDISVGNDNELLELMYRSGCRELLIGLESASQVELTNIELKADWKRKSFNHYERNIRNIQSHGIRVLGCFMLGLDEGHATESARLIEQFIKQTELFDVQLTLRTAFPGTPLYKQIREERRLATPGDYANCTLFDLNILPSDHSAEEIVGAFRNLLRTVNSHHEVSRRRFAFKKILKERRNGDLHASA